ncbi:MAG: hypothetical protein EOP84_26295, partial [Verrucomicrobiaceae bacterium]
HRRRRAPDADSRAVFWLQARAALGFGLGFRVVEEPGKFGQPSSKGEFGWLGAYHTIYWVDPAEGLTIVYMTQLSPTEGLEDQFKVRALIYSALN